MLAVIINGGKQFSDINPNSETEPSASKHGELSLVAGWRLHPPGGWIMVRGGRSWTGWTQDAGQERRGLFTPSCDYHLTLDHVS